MDVLAPRYTMSNQDITANGSVQYELSVHAPGLPPVRLSSNPAVHREGEAIAGLREGILAQRYGRIDLVASGGMRVTLHPDGRQEASTFTPAFDVPGNPPGPGPRGPYIARAVRVQRNGNGGIAVQDTGPYEDLFRPNTIPPRQDPVPARPAPRPVSPIVFAERLSTGAGSTTSVDTEVPAADPASSNDAPAPVVQDQALPPVQAGLVNGTSSPPRADSVPPLQTVSDSSSSSESEAPTPPPPSVFDPDVASSQGSDLASETDQSFLAGYRPLASHPISGLRSSVVARTSPTPAPVQLPPANVSMATILDQFRTGPEAGFRRWVLPAGMQVSSTGGALEEVQATAPAGAMVNHRDAKFLRGYDAGIRSEILKQIYMSKIDAHRFVDMPMLEAAMALLALRDSAVPLVVQEARTTRRRVREPKIPEPPRIRAPPPRPRPRKPSPPPSARSNAALAQFRASQVPFGRRYPGLRFQRRRGRGRGRFRGTVYAGPPFVDVVVVYATWTIYALLTHTD
ncbi:hypothetical protein EIP91_009875 [Steccherinum ochraceum]|uniref:Uncharacterized protein n=1 Tax=Steccherinum ochraceum TaxID=92696 RepID=A0A4R0RAE9_9APHY|nr:hypothetical protein EIP91_009875 [Steccherinum ochraceum]